jgi:hypothetical protein
MASKTGELLSAPYWSKILTLIIYLVKYTLSYKENNESEILCGHHIQCAWIQAVWQKND